MNALITRILKDHHMTIITPEQNIFEKTTIVSGYVRLNMALLYVYLKERDNPPPHAVK